MLGRFSVDLAVPYGHNIMSYHAASWSFCLLNINYYQFNAMYMFYITFIYNILSHILH